MIYSVIFLFINFFYLVNCDFLCEDESGCQNEMIVSSYIICHGSYSCQDSTLIASDYIFCGADRSCADTTMQIWYDNNTTYDTTTFTLSISNTSNLELYCYGSYSCESSVISNVHYLEKKDIVGAVIVEYIMLI